MTRPIRALVVCLSLVVLAPAAAPATEHGEPSGGLLVGADARSIVPDRDGDGEPDLERIYLGGFGLGPYRVFDPDYEPVAYVGPENRPAEGVDPLGIWVRSIAFGNARGETVVVQSLDLQGFFLGFKGCDCGVAAIQAGFEAATGVPAANLLVHATHQHAGPNVLGHQGGVPSWYLEQIRDRAIDSATAAVAALEPASLGAGTVHTPQYHGQRRDTYVAAIDDTWCTCMRHAPTDRPSRRWSTTRLIRPCSAAATASSIPTIRDRWCGRSSVTSAARPRTSTAGSET